VQLPGVQTGPSEDILGRVATPSSSVRDMQNNAFEAQQLGRGAARLQAPTRHIKTRFGSPVSCSARVIATGTISPATTRQSQGRSAVNSSSTRAPREHAQDHTTNLNKKMAVVLIEKRREVSEVQRQKVNAR